jgi:nucleotide-binding universal stress UspA family protein
MSEGLELIIVGVDRSDTARAAAESAARLAKMTGARLHVISAISSAKSGTVSAPGGEEFFIDQAEEARAHLLGLASSFEGIDTDVAVVEGKPADALCAEAERLHADLIVVGNKRMQGVARVLGAVAADVAKKAHCDVYIAHTTG